MEQKRNQILNPLSNCSEIQKRTENNQRKTLLGTRSSLEKPLKNSVQNWFDDSQFLANQLPNESKTSPLIPNLPIKRIKTKKKDNLDNSETLNHSKEIFPLRSKIVFNSDGKPKQSPGLSSFQDFILKHHFFFF